MATIKRITTPNTTHGFTNCTLDVNTKKARLGPEGGGGSRGAGQGGSSGGSGLSSPLLPLRKRGTGGRLASGQAGGRSRGTDRVLNSETVRGGGGGVGGRGGLRRT